MGSYGGGGGGGNLIFDGTTQSLPLAGLTWFEDGDKTSVEMTMAHWEGKNVNLDHEELIMVDKDGFACAYFKGGKNSVGFSMPEGVNPAELTLTHIHPVTGSSDQRSIGGTFSVADLTNHINLGLKETRAAAKEGTYRFWSGPNADAQGFLGALNNARAEINRSTAVKVTNNRGSKTYQIDTFLNEWHKWYSTNAPKYGYHYQFDPN